MDSYQTAISIEPKPATPDGRHRRATVFPDSVLGLAERRDWTRKQKGAGASVRNYPRTIKAGGCSLEVWVAVATFEPGDAR